jgi:hypothetical protein
MAFEQVAMVIARGRRAPGKSAWTSCGRSTGVGLSGVPKEPGTNTVGVAGNGHRWPSFFSPSEQEFEQPGKAFDVGDDDALELCVTRMP